MDVRKQSHQGDVTGSTTDIGETGDVEVETDLDNSEEPASLVESTSVASTSNGPPVLSVTQYISAGEVIYCITDSDQVDLQPVPIIDEEDAVAFREFNLGQNFGPVNQGDSPSQSLNPDRKRKGVIDGGILANQSKKRVNKTNKAKNTSKTRSKDIGTKRPSTRQVKTTKKTSKPATPQTLSKSEKEANAIAKTEKLKAKKRSLTCSECGKVSVCQYQHNNHVESHERRRQKYKKCPNCEEKFPNRKALAAHKTGVHGKKKRIYPHKKPLPCTHCGKLWKYESELQKHMQSHTNTRKFKCSYCSKTFDRYLKHFVHEYNIHNKRTGDGPGKEQVKTVSAVSQTDDEKCGESTTEKILDREEDCNKKAGMLSRVVPFKCSYCDTVFADRNKAYVHEHNSHAKEIEADREKKQREGSNVDGSKTVDLKMLKCSFCGKVFQHMEHYKKHVRTHTKEKSYKCKYCDISYAQEDSLYIHEHNVHGKGKDCYSNNDMVEDTENKGEGSNKNMTEDTANKGEDSNKDMEEDTANKGEDSNKDMAEDTANKGEDSNKDMTEDTANKDEDSKRDMTEDTANKDEDSNKDMTEDTANKDEDSNKEITEDTANKDEDSNKDMTEDTANKDEDSNKEMTEDTANKGDDSNKDMTEDTASKGDDSNKDMAEDTANKGEDSNKDMTEDTANKGENSNKDMTEDTANKVEDSNKDMTEDTANKGEDSNKDMTEDTANRVKGEDRRGKKRFPDCTRCGNIFRSKRDLDNHMKKHEGIVGPVRDRPYTCKQCGHVSHTQSDHIRHIKIHPPGKKPHQCQECEKSFVLKQGLTIHVKRVHLNLKPHKCSLCDRAFSMKYRLALHMRIHTGEKPFTCEYCKKTFRFMNVLKTHLAQHTGERPHVCDHCDKTFVKRSVLNIHLMTHTTELKMQCSYCEKTFGDKKYLDKHLKTHMAVS